MFAYCGNNPVNREDPTGHAFMQVDYNTSGQPIGMFVDVGCGSASCGLFGANTVSLVEDKEPITERTGTTAYGLSLSGAFGIAGSVAFAVTFDERGNVGFMFTKSIGGGTPSAGINLFKTTTNAPSIQDQAGGGLNMGGSVSVGPLSAGGEYNMLLAGEDMYHGYTVEAGTGIGLPAEFHAAYSDTNVWEIFNLYEALWGIVIWD